MGECDDRSRRCEGGQCLSLQSKFDSWTIEPVLALLHSAHSWVLPASWRLLEECAGEMCVCGLPHSPSFATVHCLRYMQGWRRKAWEWGWDVSMLECCSSNGTISFHLVPFQNLDLGVRTDGVRVNDVVMPPWAKGMTRYCISLIAHIKCCFKCSI